MTQTPTVVKEPAVDPSATAVTSLSFSAVIVYAGLTAVILLLFILLTQVMRQQPLYRSIPGIARPRGWTAVTDQAMDFTFNLPPGWVVSQPGQASPPRPFADAVDQAEIQAIRRHYTPLSGQPMPLLLAANEPAQAHLLIAELPPITFSDLRQNLQAFVEADNIEISQHPLDFNQIFFLDRVTIDEAPWRCVGRLFAWQPSPYLMVICVMPDQYTLIADDIRPILNSFQPLFSP